MSSQDLDVDVDVDVVSSPEPSPRGCGNATTDDEGPHVNNHHQQQQQQQQFSPVSSLTAAPTAASLAATLLTTTANLSPTTFQNLHNHSAHLLSSQYHSHLSNSLLNSANSNKENHIISAVDCGRLSPPRTPETNNNSISSKLSPTTTNSGFTSFSISSILSRQDSPSAKKHLIAPIPSFPHLNGTQDAAMISR